MVFQQRAELAKGSYYNVVGYELYSLYKVSSWFSALVGPTVPSIYQVLNLGLKIFFLIVVVLLAIVNKYR